jgi:hypothetical protein
MALAYWDGSVAAVYAADSGDAPSIADMQRHVETAWTALAEVAAEFGARGETHVVLLVNAEHPAAARAPVRPEPIERRTALVQPDVDDIGRVQRGLARALGRHELER